MSPRPIRDRYIQQPPQLKGFRPIGQMDEDNDPVILNFDEYEALKLADYENLTQEQAAVSMKVSRPTFTRIYDRALKKIACSFIEMKAIIIKGGHVSFEDDWYYCEVCNEYFKTIKGFSGINKCPVCKSMDIRFLQEKKNLGKQISASYKKRIISNGFRVCQKCKIKVKHAQSLPGNMTFCPVCGVRMRRTYTSHKK